MNTASKNSDISAQLASLQELFRKQLPEKIAMLESPWKAYLDNNLNQLEMLKSLHRSAHTLAGSGGTFGAYDISKKARELEILLKSYLDQTPAETEHSLNKESQNEIQTLIQNLKQTALSWKPSDVPNIFSGEIKSQEIRDNDLIYIVEDDELLAKEITSHLKAEDYKIKTFSNLADFEESCLQENPAAILMDMVFSEGETAGANIIQKLQKLKKDTIPVIFMSVRSDIEARLAAAKAGAVRYFTKPIDFEKLILTLDGFTAHTPKEPYRILLIDDDENLLSFYKMVLEKAKMKVRAVQNPMETLKHLSEFDPDIVVADVYMPECTGPEIAQIIRQDDQYAQMPIMFLSTETDLSRQLAAVNLGGDDFLMKPVEADHLISALTARVKRSRWIRQLNLDLKNALRESKYRHITLDQHANVVITDTEGKILDANDKFCKVGGYIKQELIGKNLGFLKSDFHSKEFYLEIFKSIKRGSVWHGVISNKRNDGSVFWMDSTVVPFLDDSGKAYQYVWALTDISQLRSSMEEAEKANRAKSQFLSSMSHELRTPLNAIIGFGQLLKVDAKNQLDQLHIDNIDEIIKAGNHLLQLINEILDLSKIESGHIDFSIEAVPLGNILTECISLIHTLADKKNLTISVESDGRDLPLDQLNQVHIFARADYTRLKQILLNLMSNAIKYNRENGKIIISLEQSEDQHIKVDVKDTGAGMTPEQLSQLFTAFNRLGKERTGIEGTGIGLIITKNLIEMMAGSIGVESKFGEGSTFWIKIPQEIQSFNNNENLKENIPTDSTEAPSSQEYQVLYVEDNPSNLRLVTQVLAHRPNIHLHSSHDPLQGLNISD
ncbi:MAG: response regulator, partial [Spirochaetia bacterium]|nr:response regulator [Spirochaetia bacterium]